MNRDRSVYNVTVDPLDMARLLGDTVTMSSWVLGYTVNMSMWDMRLHGLADVELEEVRVERNTDLSEVRARVLIHVDTLFTSGMFS